MKKVALLIFCLLLASPVFGAYNVTTLQEYEQDVKNNLATEADPYHPDSTLDDFINMACRDVASYKVIVRMDSVVLATTGVSHHIKGLNDDVLEVIAVFPCTVMASRGLDRIAFKDWGKIPGSVQLTGISFFAVQPPFVTDSSSEGPSTAANLWLYPGASTVDTLTILCAVEANELSADADTSNIPYGYRPLVVMYATGLAFARAQAYSKAAWWFAFYDQTMTKRLLFDRQYQLDYIVTPKAIGK